MNFKDNVMFYLNKGYFYEEDEDGEEGEESVKTDKCPNCGKKKCTCKASKTTKTIDDEDNCGLEHCSKKSVKKHCSVNGAEPDDADEDDTLKVMKKQTAKDAKKNASKPKASKMTKTVGDDDDDQYHPKTMKEALFGFTAENVLNEERAIKANKIKDVIESKKASKKLAKKAACGKKDCSEACRKISIAEDNYIKGIPGALLEYKALLSKYEYLF